MSRVALAASTTRSASCRRYTVSGVTQAILLPHKARPSMQLGGHTRTVSACGPARAQVAGLSNYERSAVCDQKSSSPPGSKAGAPSRRGRGLCRRRQQGSCPYANAGTYRPPCRRSGTRRGSPRRTPPAAQRRPEEFAERARNIEVPASGHSRTLTQATLAVAEPILVCGAIGTVERVRCNTRHAEAADLWFC